MRENRLYSSEGGARSNPSFLPLSDRDSASRCSRQSSLLNNVIIPTVSKLVHVDNPVTF